jgi:hypothetical protein
MIPLTMITRCGGIWRGLASTSVSISAIEFGLELFKQALRNRGSNFILMMEKAMRSDPNNDGVRLKLKEIMTIMIAKHKVESRNEFIPSLLISYYRFCFLLLGNKNSTNKYMLTGTNSDSDFFCLSMIY